MTATPDGLVFAPPLDGQIKGFFMMGAAFLRGQEGKSVGAKLAVMLKAPHTQAQLAARNMLATAVLTSPKPNALIVAQAGLLPDVLALLDVPDLAAKSVAAVTDIAEAAPEAVLRSGCLSRIVPLLTAASTATAHQLRAEIAGLLSRLAANTANPTAVIEAAKHTRALCATAVAWKLAPAGSDMCRGLKHCVAAVISAARGGQLQAVIDGGAIPAMLELVAAHGAVVDEAVSFVLSLSGSAAVRSAVVASKGHVTIVDQLAKHGNVAVQKKLVQILGNLCVDDATLVAVAAVPGVIAQLHDLMAGTSVDTPLGQQLVKALLNLLTTEKNIAAFREAGGVSTAVAYCRETKDENVRQLVTYLIANLLTDDATIQPLLAEHGVQLLVPLLAHPNLATRRDATRAVSNLCIRLDEPRMAVLDAGGLAPLITSITSQEPETQSNAFSALMSLACCTQKAALFKDEKLVRDAAKYLRTADADMRLMAFKLFGNMALNTVLKPFLFRVLTMPAVLPSAKADPDPRVRIAALRLLVALAAEGRVRKWMMENSETAAIKSLIATAKDADTKSLLENLAEVLNLKFEHSYPPDDVALPAPARSPSQITPKTTPTPAASSSSASSSPTPTRTATPSRPTSLLIDEAAAAKRAEKLEQQRKAVQQAKIEAEIARENAEKEKRKRVEEEERKRVAAAKKKAEEDEKRKAEEEHARAQAQKRQEEEERERRRMEDETRKKQEEALERMRREKAREEQIKAEQERMHREQEERQRELARQRQLEEQTKREEEQRRLEQEELKRKRAERELARQRHLEQLRLEQERKEQEEAAARLREEEAKLKKLEEERAAAEQARKAEEAKKLSEAQKLHQRRTFIAREILETEQSYMDGLSRLITSYMRPLLEVVGTKGELANKQAIKTIFSNVEVIHNFNAVLLDRLTARMATWNETTLIGDIFIEMTTYMKVLVEYVNNYQTALTTLNKMRRELPKFAEFIETVDRENPQQKITSVLIFPVQRVPRYILLLADLLKHTPDSHPDHDNLIRALAAMKETGEFINERKRDAENMSKLHEIQASMDKKCPSICAVASRRFICEFDTVGVVKKPGASPRHGTLFVFSDCILIGRALGKGKFLWKGTIDIDALVFESVAAAKNLEFGIHLRNTVAVAAGKDAHSEWTLEAHTEATRAQVIEKLNATKAESDKRR